MQYKVPQNVDIEDRVIGPLTLRQFVIITVAAAIILVLFFILTGPLRIIFWLLAMLVGGGALFIGFAKYGDQNMELFALSAIKTLTSPRKRIWRIETATTQQQVEKVEKATSENAPKKNLEEARDDLEKLAQIVDSGGNIGTSPKDRIIPFGTHNDDGGVPDLMESGERENLNVDPLINQSDKMAPKREPLISEVAGVQPNQSFDYPKVETKDQKISRF